MILTGKTQKQVDKEKADNDEAQRVAGIKAELDALDRKSIRAIRAINAGLDVLADNVELSELEVQAKALRLSLGN